MVKLENATDSDLERLTTTCIRAFHSDVKYMPPGTPLSGPPGYDSVEWNAEQIEKAHYHKIISSGDVVGGLILYDMGKYGGHEGVYNLGRIWVDPDCQNQGIGQRSMHLMFAEYPQVLKLTLGTPSWAVRNHHFYQKVGFTKIFETEIDPDLGWSSYEYEYLKGPQVMEQSSTQLKEIEHE